MTENNYSIKIREYEYFQMGGHYSGYDLSEMVDGKVFVQSNDGYHQMLDWIEEQYQIWLKDHKLRPSKLGYYSKEKELPKWLTDEWEKQGIKRN